MRLQRLDFWIRFRKFMSISAELCYRSVWDHPFLVGLVCFFMFLYKSFPLLFSALVTASPVLVCTAVLLGTLLSFGSPDVPEIDENEEEEEEEERVSREVSELKTRVTEDHTVVGRDVGDDDDFVAETHVEKVNLVDNEVDEDAGSIRYKLLMDDDLDTRDIHCENGVVDEVEGSSSDDSLVEKKREIREVILGNGDLSSTVEASDDHHVLADVVVGEGHELKEDLGDEQRGDESDSSFAFSWKRPVDNEDDGDDDHDDESMDSDSDGAESSSPDASMVDIIPMLDELHPLLVSGAAPAAHSSDDGSDAASERSHGSTNDASVESDNHGEEDEDEGEGMKGDKEDESKSAIKWTDDDEKNLMDLGISELERNQRLGNLIARRRARKNTRMMLEKNLIDLDIADIPLNITPISTTRRNPFELPYDSYDDLGLPPIPGSAPSIMQPRRNPFDLPYDPSEEKPDLKGDSFQEEFAGLIQRETVPRREAFLRRHESFNVGPSSLGVTRQELKWKPFSALEQLATGGCSPSLFRRQWSEVSESKLSSLPDTESVFSVVDDDGEREQDQETELIANEVRASFHDERESLSSGDVEPPDVGLGQVENRVARHDVVEITLGDRESQLGTESNLPEAGAAAHVELYGIDDDQHSEPVYDSSPSVEKILSFSSVSSEIQAETFEMGSCSMSLESTNREPEGLRQTTEQGTSSFQEIHTESSECDVTYAAPLGVSSTFADSNVSLVPESVVEFVPTDAGSLSSDEGSVDGVPNKNLADLLSFGAEMNLAVDQGRGTMFDSSLEEQQHPTNPNESSEAEPGDRHAVDKEDTKLERDEIHSSSSSEHELVGGSVSPTPKEEIIQTEWNQMHSSNFDASLEVDDHSDKGEELSLTGLSRQHTPSTDVGSSTAEEPYHPYHIAVAQVSQVDPSEDNLEEVHKNESEIDQVRPTCSDSKTDTGLHHDMNSEGIPSNSSYENMPSRENPSPELENQLLGSDHSTHELPIDEHDKPEEPTIIATESRPEVDIGNNDVDVCKVHDHESNDELSTNHTSMTSESTSPAESPEHALPIDRDDMKDRILNEMEHEGDPGEISEHLNHASEVHALYVNEENITEDDDEKKIKEIEGTSVEDIDSASKQLNDGVDVEEVILPSTIESQQDQADANRSSDIQNGSSEVERNDAATEPKNEHEEAYEKSSLNLEGKKAKSHDSSSSSSSSSSSISSDSE